MLLDDYIWKTIAVESLTDSVESYEWNQSAIVIPFKEVFKWNSNDEWTSVLN